MISHRTHIPTKTVLTRMYLTTASTELCCALYQGLGWVENALLVPGMGPFLKKSSGTYEVVLMVCVFAGRTATPYLSLIHI